MKPIKINGVKVNIELSKSDSKNFPQKLESIIKVKDNK